MPPQPVQRPRRRQPQLLPPRRVRLHRIPVAAIHHRDLRLLWMPLKQLLCKRVMRDQRHLRLLPRPQIPQHVVRAPVKQLRQHISQPAAVFEVVRMRAPRGRRSLHQPQQLRRNPLPRKPLLRHRRQLGPLPPLPAVVVIRDRCRRPSTSTRRRTRELSQSHTTPCGSSGRPRTRIFGASIASSRSYNSPHGVCIGTPAGHPHAVGPVIPSPPQAGGQAEIRRVAELRQVRLGQQCMALAVKRVAMPPLLHRLQPQLLTSRAQLRGCPGLDNMGC